MNNPHEHTPAPWSRNGDTIVGVSDSKDAKHNICELLSPMRGDDNLIQAAPELFEALCMALPYVQYLTQHHDDSLGSIKQLRREYEFMLQAKKKAE